jgi:RNA-directed DNA polymerase
MAAVRTAGAPSNLCWSSVDWRSVEKEVWRLQVRIAKAVREKRWGKVRALQRLLTRSRAARLWAVRRVTTNKGKRTPGVDGVIWRTSGEKLAAVDSLKRKGYRPQPLRRMYIPKRNHKLRPLSIPTMRDRAMQALYLLALNPVAETMADPHSYGFRLRRCVADAWGQCYIALAKGYAPEWVFEGDIESCLETATHYTSASGGDSKRVGWGAGTLILKPFLLPRRT